MTEEALSYKITISNSIFESVHGRDRVVDELWFSQHKLIVNSNGGCFFNNEPRMSTTTKVSIATNYVQTYLKIAKLTEELEVAKKEAEGIYSIIFPK